MENQTATRLGTSSTAYHRAPWPGVFAAAKERRRGAVTPQPRADIKIDNWINAVHLWKGSMKDEAETIRQARTWVTVKGHYLQLRLCSACAAQAAYGHQIGFSRINSPCDSCRPTILSLPVKEPGEWRSDSPRRGDAHSVRTMRQKQLVPFP